MRPLIRRNWKIVKAEDRDAPSMYGGPYTRIVYQHRRKPDKIKVHIIDGKHGEVIARASVSVSGGEGQ